MKILFICDTMGSGGAERVISILSNSFIAKEHYVSILMIGRDASDTFYKLNSKINLLYLSKEKLGFFKKTKLIKETILGDKPDVVISFLSYVCIYTWWALRHTKIPYIVSERNDPNHRGRLKQRLLNKSFKKAKGCVFQTEDALNWYSKVSKDKSVIIHNPVSLDYCPDKIPEVKKQILYVGRLNEQKNCSMLIEAFKLFEQKHPGYIFKMYGNGPLESELKKQVAENHLEDKVFIAPSSKTWQKGECGSSMFVLGSKFEGMPNVLAEALSLGIPSVSTDCTIGGPKELKRIFPELLVLSKSDSVLDFALAMEEAINISRSISRIPNKLTDEYITHQWLSFIDKIVEDKKYVR